MKTIVVTGASGFIGRRLCQEAARRGWRVRALARSAIPREAPENVTYARWDALDPEPPVNHLAGADLVCHLAAFIPRDFNDPATADDCFRINAGGVLKLLKAASETGLRRVIYFSSGNAYAPGAQRATEDSPQRPSERAPYYLMSKVCGEVFAEHWARNAELRLCTLRLGSVYGPGMDERGLIPTLARRLLNDEAVQLRDGGQHKADFIHVDDVVAASLAAAEGEAVGPFNIGSGESTTALALAEMLRDLTGAPASLVRVEPEAQGEGAPSGFAALDIARACAALGYRARPLRDGLRDYLAWLSSSRRASGMFVQ